MINFLKERHGTSPLTDNAQKLISPVFLNFARKNRKSLSCFPFFLPLSVTGSLHPRFTLVSPGTELM